MCVERTSSTVELIVFGCVMENPKKIFSRKKDARWIMPGKDERRDFSLSLSSFSLSLLKIFDILVKSL